MTPRRFTDTELADLSTRATSMLDRQRVLLGQDSRPADIAAARSIAETAHKYGLPGIRFIVRVWVDTLIRGMPGADKASGQRFPLAFTDETQTRLLRPDEITAAAQFAAAVITARISEDHVMFYQLMDALPQNNQGVHILYTMVRTIALQLNGYEQPAGPLPTGFVALPTR